MKNLIPFWTPIRSRQHPFLECVDAYFHIRGPVATAVGISATLHDAPSRYKHLKLLSYASLLPPLILLICKYFLRKKHHFILHKRLYANGIEEIGLFKDGLLERGLRMTEAKALLIEPYLILDHDLKYNFAIVPLFEQEALLPVEHKGTEFFLAKQSSYEILWKLIQQKNVLKTLFEHPKTTLTIQGFLDFLKTTYKHLPEQSCLELSSLAKTHRIQLPKDFLVHWIKAGKADLIKQLITDHPNLLDVSLFTQAAMHGNLKEAEILFQLIQEHHLQLSPNDRWLRMAMLGETSFSEEEFAMLPLAMRESIHRIANLCVHKPLVSKLRSLGFSTTPSPPIWVTPISSTMDCIAIEEKLKATLTSLYQEGTLLPQCPPSYETSFFKKKDALGRVLGRKYLLATAATYNFDLIKSPRKFLVPISPILQIDVHVGYNSLIHIESKSLLLFAEPIEKVTGYITRDQMRTLLDIVETTCATDLCCDNFFMGKNLDGEVGIYFIDTEYKTFSFPVSKSSTGYLKELLVPEDHSWFSEEQRHRYPEKQKHPRSIISADEAKQLHRYGFSKNPRTFTFATNTIFSV